MDWSKDDWSATLTRILTIGLLLFAVYRVAFCPCPTGTKSLLSCQDHRWQFEIATGLAILVPLLEQKYKSMSK